VVALAGNNAEARSWLAVALLSSGDYEGALAEVERALEISPNSASAHAGLEAVLIYSGRPKEGLAEIQRYLRLDPRDPAAAVYLLQVAVGHYFCRDYEAAVEAAKRVIRSYPDFPLPYRWLPAALGQAGRIDEAREALEKAVAIAPAMFDMYVRRRAPWHRPDDYSLTLDGMRKAGWDG